MMMDVDFETKLTKIEKKVAILKIASSLNHINTLTLPKTFETASNNVHEELLNMLKKLDTDETELPSTSDDKARRTTRVFLS